LLFNGHSSLSTKLHGGEDFYHDAKHQKKYAKLFHGIKESISIPSINVLLDAMKEGLTLRSPIPLSVFSKYIADYERLSKVKLPFRALELFKFTRSLMKAEGVDFIEAFMEFYHCPKGAAVGYDEGSATGIALSSFVEVAKHGITFTFLMHSI
jgi:hypothetical protein